MCTGRQVAQGLTSTRNSLAIASGQAEGGTLLMFFRKPLKEEALMHPMKSRVRYCNGKS